MKKMMFLMLTLMVLGAANVNAQVTIGGESDPHDFSVLELIGNTTGTGLRLPQLTTEEQSALTTKLKALEGDNASAAKGLTVYNTNNDALNIWDGGSWIISASSKPIRVDSLYITGGTYVEVGKTLQLKANVLPQNAAMKNVYWKISSGGSFASIDQTGLLTAVAAGPVTVSILSMDGSGLIAEHVVNVAVATPAWSCGDDIVDLQGNNYSTIFIAPLCWMKDNLKTTVGADGSALIHSAEIGFFNGYVDPNFDESNVPAMGYLYNYNAATVACPNGWRLPTNPEVLDNFELVATVQVYPGRVNEIGLVREFGETARYWTSTVHPTYTPFALYSLWISLDGRRENRQLFTDSYVSVRCVLD